MPPAALTAEKSAWTAWGPCGKLPVSGPVSPLTLPNVIGVGVTPVSDAVLPAVPVQSRRLGGGGEVEAGRGGGRRGRRRWRPPPARRRRRRRRPTRRRRWPGAHPARPGHRRPWSRPCRPTRRWWSWSRPRRPRRPCCEVASPDGSHRGRAPPGPRTRWPPARQQRQRTPSHARSCPRVLRPPVSPTTAHVCASNDVECTPRPNCLAESVPAGPADPIRSLTPASGFGYPW